MKTKCTECGQETSQPIIEVVREGKTLEIGPLCQQCWARASRANDDAYYNSIKHANDDAERDS